MHFFRKSCVSFEVKKKSKLCIFDELNHTFFKAKNISQITGKSFECFNDRYLELSAFVNVVSGAMTRKRKTSE